MMAMWHHDDAGWKTKPAVRVSGHSRNSSNELKLTAVRQRRTARVINCYVTARLLIISYQQKNPLREKKN